MQNIRKLILSPWTEQEIDLLIVDKSLYFVKPRTISVNYLKTIATLDHFVGTQVSKAIVKWFNSNLISSLEILSIYLLVFFLLPETYSVLVFQRSWTAEIEQWEAPPWTTPRWSVKTKRTWASCESRLATLITLYRLISYDKKIYEYIYVYLMQNFFAGMRLECKMAELHLCMTGYDPIWKPFLWSYTATLVEGHPQPSPIFLNF